MTEAKVACRLKSRRLNLTALHIYRTDPSAIADQLSEIVSGGGDFMHHAPVVVTMEQACDSETLAAIVQVIRDAGLVPVGLSGAVENPESVGLTLVDAVRATASQSTAHQASAAATFAKTVEQPVRSGQQIYARGTDLIVHGAVGEGAEVVADGSIHVYGPLRGRAIAGASGREDARIYALRFYAELVAIAGHYKVLDDQPGAVIGQSVCARLVDEALSVSAL